MRHGHKTYIGHGSIRTAEHIKVQKGHRLFTHPVKPVVSAEAA